ncbi:MAG: 3-methyl-2-oxobutanoate hydroxymethyltransferase [Chromatiales bacterium]|nr:3-methyl-2-oxobutanoate hydroxymethyltransferase [Chromatiales bacterium]
MCSSFDYFHARACELAGMDAIGAAGSFINFFVRGRLSANDDTLEDALMALEGVRNGAPNTFIFMLPPFADEFCGVEQSLRNSATLYAAGADAIRIQGASKTKLQKMEVMTQEGIPVGGHLGLMPRFTTWFGGFKCQGKNARDALRIYEEAKRVEEAGACWIELECVPYKVAAEITKRIGIPIIGIGSGPDCDGEVQVHLDTLGLQNFHIPKHSKVYTRFHEESIEHLTTYRNEVVGGVFPTTDYGFKIDDDEFDLFMNEVEKAS